jgi:hypothetical protein
MRKTMTELPKIKKLVEVPVQTWGDLVAYATRDREPEIRVGDVVTKYTDYLSGSFPRGVCGVVKSFQCIGDVVVVMWPRNGKIVEDNEFVSSLTVSPMHPDTPLFD